MPDRQNAIRRAESRYLRNKEALMPYVKVEIAKGIANVEQKRAVIRRITEVLVEEFGRNPEYTFVVIDEVDTDNWGRGGLSLTEQWARTSAKQPPEKSS
jgi:4-oxalocrotonate tautomerase